MLSYRLLKNHAGLLLIGDYDTLRDLHEAVHGVDEKSPLPKGRDDFFLGLAYDVRKAYERQRETIEPDAMIPERGPRYGVPILWPTLLVQSRILRVGLGYVDSSKAWQAITYSLEAVIESALRDDFGAQAGALIDQWVGLSPETPGFIDMIYTRGALFCSWSKAKRSKGLGELLWSFTPMYESLYQARQRAGHPLPFTPADLAEWEGYEWPDPHW